MTNKQRAEYESWDKTKLITEINRLMKECENARAKVLDDVHKAMANKYHCREDMCEVGMTCADCLKEYMNELYKEQK